MKLNYKTKENETISLEIREEELANLTGMIMEIGQIFKGSDLTLEEFFKGVVNPSTDAEQADTEEPEEQRDLLIKCRSVKSKIYPERFVLVKQYLKHQNIDYEISARESDAIIYYLTGRQMEELMAHLNRNECATDALI